MKYTILAVSAVLCMGSAFGAAINATNLLAGTGDTIVTDNAGNAVSGLWSGLTTFGGGAAPSDIAGLSTIDPSLIIGTSDIVGVANGAFNNTYNGPDGTGEAIYLILANNADLTAATLFGLINTGQTLDPDGATPDSNNYILSASAGSALIGAFNAADASADWTNLVGGPITGPQFQLELVPEPSTSLLAGLAALGLLIRRKR